MSEVNPDKPCPFCGNPTVQTTVDDGCHWSSCPKCSTTGPTEFLRSDEDSPGWNTRPDFDRVTAERDAALGREAALQSELKRYQHLFHQANKAIDRMSNPGANNGPLAVQQPMPADDELKAPFYIRINDFNELVRGDIAIVSVRVSRERRGEFTEPLYGQQRLTAADQREDDRASLEHRHRAEFEACQAAERRVEVLEGLLQKAAWHVRLSGTEAEIGAIDAALNPTAEGASQ